MSINSWRIPVQPWLRSTDGTGFGTVARNQIDGWEALVLQAVNAQTNWADGINRQLQNSTLIPAPTRNVLAYVQNTTEQMVQMQGTMWRKWFEWLRSSTGDAENVGAAPEPAMVAAVSKPKVLREVQATPIEPQPVPVSKPELTADDLTALHGIGPAIAKKLNAAGVVSFRQIAAWTDADVEKVEDTVLAGRFAGRIRKDDWVEQAREMVTASA